MKRPIFLFLVSLILVAPAIWLAFLVMESAPPGLRFELVAFEDLPGWDEASFQKALPALIRSCDKLDSLPASRRLPGAAVGGRVADWAEACDSLQAASIDGDVRSALQTHFTPLAVSLAGETAGTFTGYYEALLRGNLQKTERFNTPLYARPPELVMVNLGDFRADLAGRRVAGKVVDGRLVPYPNRAAIEGGALKDRALEVLWVDSPVDAYFLHVQGSGRVLMPDGSFLGVGYAAQNGHPNQLIGRHLLQTGAIPREQMSGQSIRAWLAANPEAVQQVLNTDPSFVFFREIDVAEGPIGSANVPLTAEVSLAVDRKHLPLHAPVWLSASHPNPVGEHAPDEAFNSLMVAQDTGGAITGEIRGDVFWGFGDRAEEIAGRMANEGRYWLILPKALAVAASDGR